MPQRTRCLSAQSRNCCGQMPCSWCWNSRRLRALGIADLQAARADVQEATGSEKPPGARLHLLTIGVSDYGDKAKHLTLKFAHRDAQDAANALITTQKGGLYADVKPMFLHDSTANKVGIFDALMKMEKNMATDDFAVVMFSGHGTMIDGRFYLVPYGVDDSTPANLQASSIPATEFRSLIEKVATHGRVLVLLDACRSAGIVGGVNTLKEMAAGNVTVLTSSTADKVSRESEDWHHGFFAKALLDAFSGIDVSHKHVISMGELSAYMRRHLWQLTKGDQQLGVSINFEGDVFVAGL
jgi:uncharacterized caspase-like protein